MPDKPKAKEQSIWQQMWRTPGRMKEAEGKPKVRAEDDGTWAGDTGVPGYAPKKKKQEPSTGY